MSPRTEALVVHLFVAADSEHRADDLARLRSTWQACGSALGMTGRVPDIDLDPKAGWDDDGTRSTGLLAARTRPGSGVCQAVLRREHDVFCLSAVLEPDSAEGVGWAELDRRWSAAAGGSWPGVLGVARLFLARTADSAAVPEAVRTGVPADPAAPLAWRERGITVPQGFAVWEASSRVDTRPERRLVVLAAEDRDVELSAWTWLGAGLELPPLAKYLLHAAKMRYQLRVWKAAEGVGNLRREADTIIQRLLAAVGPTWEPGRGPSWWRRSAS
ncbi:CATRA conflict system CASPASE/TPR repeat-associated protein [Saccharothrix deserti]|uniref:CATRA conflict system CASPASE/TPR repeat-associated protein n=1 Tax=Saccharothrix deserti TaxID=2593674 RepID=UPI00131E1B7C|nr:CATRA conflict system CASPASE/TPR repeat-associated protein [Saccharothrix deserti]